MSNDRLLIALFALLCSLPLLAGPKIQSWQTENGAKVLFVQADELPMLDLRITFDAGSARDGELPGIGAMVNGLLVDGAGDWNADQIAERFESVGSQVDHGSLRDMSFVSLRTLTEPQALETSLETLTQVIGKPNFEADDIERNREIMLANLRQEEQDPRALARKRFFAELYGEHPYASHSEGTVESIRALDQAALRAHHQRYFVARNAVIAIVGQVDRAGAEKIANRVLSSLPAGEAAPELPQVRPLEKADSVHLPFPSSQSHIYIGQVGMKRGDADYFTLYVGNHVLGGSGLVSRMSDEVREKRGLSYSVYSYFSPMRLEGPFTMNAQTRNSSRDEAVRVMRETLQHFIDEGPEADELKRAKQNITGGFPVKLAGNDKIVEYLAMIGFYDLPLTYLDEFVGRVEAVTADDIRETFARRLQPERMLMVTLGKDDADAAENAQPK